MQPYIKISQQKWQEATPFYLVKTDWKNIMHIINIAITLVLNKLIWIIFMEN